MTPCHQNCCASVAQSTLWSPKRCRDHRATTSCAGTAHILDGPIDAPRYANLALTYGWWLDKLSKPLFSGNFNQSVYHLFNDKRDIVLQTPVLSLAYLDTKLSFQFGPLIHYWAKLNTCGPNSSKFQVAVQPSTVHGSISSPAIFCKTNRLETYRKQMLQNEGKRFTCPTVYMVLPILTCSCKPVGCIPHENWN